MGSLSLPRARERGKRRAQLAALMPQTLDVTAMLIKESNTPVEFQ